MLIHSVLKSNQIAQHVIADVVAKAARATSRGAAAAAAAANGGGIVKAISLG